MSEADAAVVAGQASQFVSARFLEAQTYAANAWGEANAYLSNLVTVVTHPSVDTSVVVPLSYTGESIAIAAHGTKPTTPVFDSTITVSRPAIGTLKPLPEFDFLTSDLDTLRNSIIDKLMALVADGTTGIDPTVEQAIFDRAKSRQEVDNARLYTETEQYFSARGFAVPTGAMSARLQEINIEIARNNSYLNSDIAIEQAKLAQTNFQFVVEKGSAIITQLTELSLKAVLDFNRGTIEVFTANVEAYKQEITRVLSLIEAQSKIYTAEAEVYKAVASVDNADIAAQVEIAKISLQEASLKAELELKRVSTELEAAMKLHQLQVAAYESGSKVTAQVVASALSAVNASANYGFSGSTSLGYNTTNSYDKTKAEQTTSEQHVYNHTVATT